MPKYFIEKDAITPDLISVTGETTHHLRVLRVKPGERIILCDGACMDYTCALVQIKQKDNTMLFKILEKTAVETEPCAKVSLFQGLPKGDKMEWIIKQCVELGIHRIIPVITARTIARVQEFSFKTARYRRVSESAASQSMRGIIPEITDILTFKEALALPKREEIWLAAYENEEKETIKKALNGKRAVDSTIWIGPEGGFEQNEINALCEYGAVPVTLGKRVLRTETAGMAALIQILSFWE